MSTATVRDTVLAYDSTGSSEDVLLLIHGHPFNRSMWEPQTGALQNAGWRVVAPDLRGYGDSAVVPGITTLSAFADDLVGLMDGLGIKRVVVGGLSMGGQVAMQFSQSYPERVRGLLLAATFPRAETAAGKEERLRTADRIVNEGMRSYAHELLQKLMAAESIRSHPATAIAVLKMMLDTNPLGAAAALRGRAERPDYESTLAGVEVPAVVVVGSEDAYTTRHDAHRMQTLLPLGELVWLEGIGHMPNLEAVEPFNEAVIALLGRVRQHESGSRARGSM